MNRRKADRPGSNQDQYEEREKSTHGTFPDRVMPQGDAAQAATYLHQRMGEAPRDGSSELGRVGCYVSLRGRMVTVPRVVLPSWGMYTTFSNAL